MAGSDAFAVGQALASYAGMVDYVINHQKTALAGHKPEKRFKKLHLVAALDSFTELARGLKAGFQVASAVNLARDLSNEPAGTLTPTKLAAVAKSVVAGNDCLSIKVFDHKQLKKMGAHALLAVAQGSDEKPRLIDIVYSPAGSKESDPVALTLIGKSVTFDSGGLDIKAADGMRHMKRDMSGGAVTLAAIQAIAALGLNIKVRCVMAATENMINGSSYKPGDVLQTMKGLTVEVDNTDAVAVAEQEAVAPDIAAMPAAPVPADLGDPGVARRDDLDEPRAHAAALFEQAEYKRATHRMLARAGVELAEHLFLHVHILIDGFNDEVAVGEVVEVEAAARAAVARAQGFRSVTASQPRKHACMRNTPNKSGKKTWYSPASSRAHNPNAICVATH